MQVSKAQFKKWVTEAIDNVPEKFQKRINNLVFFVEDYPNNEHLRKAKTQRKKDVLLLGLYEGYHQSKRLDTGLVFPDRITIFKKPIESLCETNEKLKNQISKTVRHEIAHHFGSDEKGAQKAGRG
ncbi:MAG: metallopeptidase family protein [Candidatus Moranbacteria bacterium]|nr:metallopeptidase family protein [Candidatus Moranbacteria bacterium]